MARTVRKKHQYRKPPSTGPDGEVWKDLEFHQDKWKRNEARKSELQDMELLGLNKVKTRKRRGKEVVIPPEWRGRTVTRRRKIKRKAAARIKKAEAKKINKKIANNKAPLDEE